MEGDVVIIRKAGEQFLPINRQIIFPNLSRPVIRVAILEEEMNHVFVVFDRAPDGFEIVQLTTIGLLVDFLDVVDMFTRPILEKIDDRFDYGEERWIAIGILKEFIHGVVVYVEKKENTIRIISARRATANERKIYENSVKK